RISDPENEHTWHSVAIGALRSLAISLNSMSIEARQINVAANMVVMADPKNESRQWQVEDVGLQGMLYDVHCIKMGRGAMPAIALGIDTRSYFPMADPD